MAPIDRQEVVRMNRDMPYSFAIFDLDASPVTPSTDPVLISSAAGDGIRRSTVTGWRNWQTQRNEIR